MRVERAARETRVARPLVAKAFHETVRAADDTDRQPTTERLAVGDEIGAHAEILLRAAAREPETHEDVVDDQHDAAARADLAQLA